jgi:hypothetical protein
MILDTIRALIERSQSWASDTEKAAHLAAVEASDLDSLITRVQALEDDLAALKVAAGYDPKQTLAPDPVPEQGPAVAAPKAKP